MLLLTTELFIVELLLVVLTLKLLLNTVEVPTEVEDAVEAEFDEESLILPDKLTADRAEAASCADTCAADLAISTRTVAFCTDAVNWALADSIRILASATATSVCPLYSPICALVTAE